MNQVIFMLQSQARRANNGASVAQQMYTSFMTKFEAKGDWYGMDMVRKLKGYSVGYLGILRKGASISGNYFMADVIAETQRRKKVYGDWWPEDDMKLRRLVTEHGTDWDKIGDMMDKTAFDCRYRYRYLGE